MSRSNKRNHGRSTLPECSNVKIFVARLAKNSYLFMGDLRLWLASCLCIKFQLWLMGLGVLFVSCKPLRRHFTKDPSKQKSRSSMPNLLRKYQHSVGNNTRMKLGKPMEKPQPTFPSLTKITLEVVFKDLSLLRLFYKIGPYYTVLNGVKHDSRKCLWNNPPYQFMFGQFIRVTSLYLKLAGGPPCNFFFLVHP